MSGRNRLLNFRHTKAATLEVTQPSAEELIEGLDRGWDFAPLPDEEPATEDSDGAQAPARFAERRGTANGIVTQKTTGPALLRALTSLRSKSTTSRPSGRPRCGPSAAPSGEERPGGSDSTATSGRRPQTQVWARHASRQAVSPSWP
ncbi:DUF4011 domain-containing protein [Streptomyces microflavus]|uniref:DUF4011 domain-containing protein n=1 Tax=Streptomyces microflavus TaxID=1919 RepID=UPI0036C33659